VPGPLRRDQSCTADRQAAAPQQHQRDTSAIDRLSRFQAMPLTKAAWYEPVRSKTWPDIQPPSAMPNSVAISTVPTRAPASAGGKCSRTMMA
jgi:hypothetical protein